MPLLLQFDRGFMYVDIFGEAVAQSRAFSLRCPRARALPSSATRTPLVLSTLQLVCLTVAGFRGRAHTKHRCVQLPGLGKKEKNQLLLFKPHLLAQIAACAVLFCEGSRRQTGKALLCVIKERRVIII